MRAKKRGWSGVLHERQHLLEQGVERGVGVARRLRRRAAERRAQLVRVADPDRRQLAQLARGARRSGRRPGSRAGASPRAAATAGLCHRRTVPARCRDGAPPGVRSTQVKRGGDRPEQAGGNRLTLLARAGELLSSSGRGRADAGAARALLVTGFAELVRDRRAATRTARSRAWRRRRTTGRRCRHDGPHGAAVVMRTGEPERRTEEFVAGAAHDIVRAADRRATRTCGARSR